MLITKRHPVHGAYITHDVVGLTEQNYFAWKQGQPIEEAMPDVSEEDRRFIVDGVPPKNFQPVTEVRTDVPGFLSPDWEETAYGSLGL